MARLSRIHFTRPLPLVAHTLRHPREDENPPHHPSFPRTHEIRNENTTQTSQTHHSHTGLPQCHSREGENDGVFFPGIGGMERWIPAFAGMTDGMDSRLCRNDAYALSRTFFTTICSHRRQAVHLMQGRIRIVNSNRFSWSYLLPRAGIMTQRPYLQHASNNIKPTLLIIQARSPQ